MWTKGFSLIIILLLTVILFNFHLTVLDAVVCQETVNIGNEFIEIFFKPPPSLDIISIYNGITKVKYAFSDSPILIMVLFNRTNNEEFCISTLDAVNYICKISENKRTLIVNYKGFKTDRFFNLNITLMINVDESEPKASFSTLIEKEEGIDIYYIKYPIISGVVKLGNKRDSTSLIIPSWGGGLVISDPSRFWYPGYPSNPYPTGEQNLQFMALFDSEGYGSLHIYTNDTQGFHKSFNWEGRGDSGLISVTHYPEFGKFRKFSPSYSVILGISSARDWRTAIEPYKKWASKQWWCKKQECSWLKDAHLVVYNTAYLPTPKMHNETWRHVSYQDIIAAAKELRKRIHLYNGTILIFVSGWEKNGHCASYPDVFPPKEGWEGLRKLVDELHKMHLKVGFFLLGSYLMLNEEWSDLEGYKYVVKDVYGKPYQSSPDYVVLDPATEYWKSNLVNISVTLVERTGVDLLYYDTVPFTPVNYAITQEHPIGGGNYTVNAWIEIFRKIREKTFDIKPDLALVTEGITEPLIPFVDGTFLGGPIFFNPFLPFLSGAESVNLFSEIYGRNITMLGTWIFQREQQSLIYDTYENTVYWRRTPLDETYTYSLISRSFLYGFPIPLGAFHGGGFNKESMDLLIHDEKLYFMEKLAFARSHYLRSFLVEGRLLERGEEGCELILNYPRGDGDNIFLKPIQYSIWSNAQGDIAKIYINIWNRPLMLSINNNATLVLVDGLPVILPLNNTINIAPKSLVAAISPNVYSPYPYVGMIRESVLKYMLKVIYDLEELYDIHGNVSLLKSIAEEVLASQNYTLESLVHLVEEFKQFYEHIYKNGYLKSASLEILIKYVTMEGGGDFFAAIDFDNAPILPSLRYPIFSEGNGVAYLSFRPMLIGYPHWDRKDELLGYHVVLFPSYSLNSSLKENNIVSVILKLAVPPGQKNITIRVSAGEHWHLTPKVDILIRNHLTNKVLLNISQIGGGWKTYKISVKDIYLDLTPPIIGIPNHIPEGDVKQNQEVKILVNVTDLESGVERVELLYSLNNDDKWISLLMTLNHTTGLFEATIPGQLANSIIKYKIIAYDNSGNSVVEDNKGRYYTFTVIPEYPPTIIPLILILIALITIFSLRRIIIQYFQKLGVKSK